MLKYRVSQKSGMKKIVDDSSVEGKEYLDEIAFLHVLCTEYSEKPRRKKTMNRIWAVQAIYMIFQII